MTETNEPQIRLTTEEAKIAAKGAAITEDKYNIKSPEQERALYERYGSLNSYQRALKIMIDSGMVDGDIELEEES